MRHPAAIMTVGIILLLSATPLYAGLGEPTQIEKYNPELITRVKSLLEENGCDSTLVDAAMAKMTPDQLSLVEEAMQSEAGGTQSAARTFNMLVIVLSIVCLFFVIWILSALF